MSSLKKPPTLEEVKDSIERMKYGKAPGPSGLKTDTIKVLAQEIICKKDEIDPNEDKTYQTLSLPQCTNTYLISGMETMKQ